MIQPSAKKAVCAWKRKSFSGRTLSHGFRLSQAILLRLSSTATVNPVERVFLFCGPIRGSIGVGEVEKMAPVQTVLIAAPERSYSCWKCRQEGC